MTKQGLEKASLNAEKMMHRKTLLQPLFDDSPRNSSVDVVKKRIFDSKLKRKAD